MKEVSRLAKQPYGSAEASVIRNYLDTCLEMPWGKETKERADVEKARAMLDKDHYGLTKVKERILEYIAVRQIHPQAKGKIICLVGPRYLRCQGYESQALPHQPGRRAG